MPACSQCASEVDESAVACTGCGAALVPSQPVLAAATPSIESAPEQAIPSSPPMSASDCDLEGIGGWLILVMLGLVLSPIVIVFSTFSTFLPLLTEQRYRPFLESHLGLHALIVFEVVTNAIFVLFLAALNYLFFKKKRGFPTYMILYLALQLVLILADTVLASTLLPSSLASASAGQGIARAVIGAAIWIPYFLRSRRVKVTFVH